MAAVCMIQGPGAGFHALQCDQCSAHVVLREPTRTPGVDWSHRSAFDHARDLMAENQGWSLLEGWDLCRPCTIRSN